MSNPTTDIYRAQRAKALLDDELFNDAIKQVRAALMDTWTRCADAGERDRIWISVNLLEQIKSALINTVGSGKIAQAEIDAIATREKVA